MAFSMASTAGGNAQARQADDLEEINTELLSFSALGGSNKLKLLPTPWPADALPPSSSTLLAVASQKGLVAAAGPESLVLASTDALRAALQTKDQAQDGVINFEPQLTISGPRLSQVAFTSDEQHLMISAESGGGLAIHEVASLMNGNKASAFQMATEGMGVRSLNPNPAPEHAELIAVVLSGGQLMLASLKERNFVKPNNNAVLKDNVSCVSWSNKGKQLVAGLGDGTAYQLKPDGSAQAIIPRPPQLEGDQHVSAIYWLTNDDFLIVHTPNQYDTDMPPESTFHFAHRDKGTQNFTFQKLVDPAPPFGMNRSPPHHFFARLRNWKPSLDDCLVVTSTTAIEIGMITRASVPLASDLPVTNAYTTTAIAIDSRRAQMLPSSNEDGTDTSAIGLAIDLSSKDKVYRPIQGSDIEWSPTPLPELLVLNNEGFLTAWWIVFNASIEQNIGYEGLIAVGGSQPPQQTQTAATTPFGKPLTSGAAPAFGAPAFGTPGGGSAFGSSSAFGANKSPWASASTGSTAGAPAFGKPAFGSPSTPGTANFGQPAFGSASKPGTAAFGAAGGLGNKGSVWGAPSNPPSQIPKPTGVFGGAASADSPFSKLAQTNNAGGSGFSAFGKTGGGISPFGNVAGKPGQSAFGGGSTFGSTATPTQSFGMSTGPSFASTVSLNSSVGGSTVKTSSFGTPTPSTNLFGQKPAAPQSHESDMADTDEPDTAATPKEPPKTNPFGLGASGFKLDSAFKGDGTDKDDLPKPVEPSGGFGLGSSFSQALGDTQNESTEPKTPAKLGPISGGSSKPEASTTPATVAPNKTGGLFGNLGKPVDKPEEKREPSPFGNFGKTAANGAASPNLFGKPAAPSPFGKPADKPASPSLFGKPADKPASPSLFGKPAEKIKSPAPEPKEEDAPLPPDFMAPKGKREEAPKAEDAPPPPDFTLPKARKEEEPKAEDAPLPPDFTLPKTKKLEEKEEDDLPPIAGSPPIKVEKPESPSLSDIPDEKGDEASPPPVPLPPYLSQSTESFSFPPLDTGKVRDSSRPRAQSKSRSPSKSPTRAASRIDFGASTTPFGLSKTQPPPPAFAPPKQAQALRSPSPVRSASTSALTGGPRREAMKIPPAAPITRATSRPSAPEPEPVLEDLPDDEEAELTRQILASSPRATRTLEEFYVHQDYAGPAGPSSVAGSIEQLYRDMQSMVDTVGLNAHYLSGFIKGHMENEGKERTRDDLEIDVDDPEAEGGWCLVEIDDLMIVENGLERSLDQGRLADVQGKIRDLIRLSKDVAQLRKRLQDVRKVIESRKDPAKLARTRAIPLSEEQAAQQLALRGSFAETQKLLSGAEEAVVLLKTRIASADIGKRGSSGVPTAEAVEKTIAKMSAMIEKKSGDLDVLETQMRKLRLLSNSGYGFDYDEEEDDDIAAGLTSLTLRGSRGPRSREGSPAFATPPANKTKLISYSREGTPGTARSSRSSRGYGLFYTPSESPAPFRSSTNGSLEGPLSGANIGEEITGEDVRVYKGKQAKRGLVADKLREAAIRRGGPKITRITP